MFIPPADTAVTLTTIRDYIRWGASQFNAHQLAFGQGTRNALDDAAALVLHSVHLPYHLAESYFDSVLTLAEREAVLALLTKRINLRIPSAYLTNEALFAGYAFYVDNRVLVPRSPIAELIEDGFQSWIDPEQVTAILDLCCGSACIAIASAYAFPQAEVDAVDISADACAVAEVNIDQHAMSDQVHLYRSDLFASLPCKKYDIIVSNPPYVSQAEWESLPAEYHAEPALGFQGGDNGLRLVVKLLAEAVNFLSDYGILIVEVGRSAETLQALFPQVPFYWLDFERGGDGVFLLTMEQLSEYHPIFINAL